MRAVVVRVNGVCGGADDGAEGEGEGASDTSGAPVAPSFPLLAGDVLRYPALGGRTQDDCPGHRVPGDCRRTLSAELDVDGVRLDASLGRWFVNAHAELVDNDDDLVDAAALAPLVLAHALPFSSTRVDAPTELAPTDFATDAAPTDALSPTGFPFFDADVNRGVLAVAGERFCDRFRALDAGAACRVIAAEQSLEVVFEDDAARDAPRLHRLRVGYHQMGFVCAWEEALVPFVDGMPRDASAFYPPESPELEATFLEPTLTRGGVSYHCSCATQVCSAGATCLSADPARPPGPCP